MRYADQKLLLEYARLQLEIAKARGIDLGLVVTMDMDATERVIKSTVGYRKLRAWFLGMSNGKRLQASRNMRNTIDAYAAIMAKAKAAGETDLSLADIELTAKEATTGEPLADIDFRSDDQPPQEQEP